MPHLFFPFPLLHDPWPPLTFLCFCSFALFRLSYSWNHALCGILDRLISLNNMYLRFFHIFLWLDSSFRFIMENFHHVAVPQFISVQFSHSVVSNSLRTHGLQHPRLLCPSPTPGVYSNLCLSSWWCHLTSSSSVIPFSFHLQSFPASESFQMSQLFASGGRSIEVSATASVLQMIFPTNFL